MTNAQKNKTIFGWIRDNVHLLYVQYLMDNPEMPCSSGYGCSQKRDFILIMQANALTSHLIEVLRVAR